MSVITGHPKQNRRSLMKSGAALFLAAGCAASIPAYSWEPSRTVEFIVPAGTGGGADQMARFIQGTIAKYKLMKEPMVVINQGGGAGAEGFLNIKDSRGDPHKLIITLSNLFTTPLATSTPFNWRDLTPVQMEALDEFVLWVNADSPYKTVKEYLSAVEAAPGKFKMGGTGSKQEDQIITASIEQQTGAKFTYISYRGGGQVAVQLVGNHVDSTVNNPIEAVSEWRAGKLRPLCVFDGKRMPYTEKMTKTMSWHDIPTCDDAGLKVEYLMLRGIFMPGGVTQDQVDYYIDLLNKVRATPDWKAFMEKGAFNQSVMSGKEYQEWLGHEEARHFHLMKAAGFIVR